MCVYVKCQWEFPFTEFTKDAVDLTAKVSHLVECVCMCVHVYMGVHVVISGLRFCLSFSVEASREKYTLKHILCQDLS